MYVLTHRIVKGVSIRSKDSAVAVVIGAVLLVAIVVALLSSFLLWYIPSSGASAELSALTGQESSFISISEKMNSPSMYTGDIVTGSVPLGIHGSPPFTSGQPTSISFTNSSSVFHGYMNYSYNVSYKPTLNINATFEINITNSQNVPTEQPFDQYISINDAQISYYNNSNYSNIDFYYNNGTAIPSWLQNVSSNGAAWWLKMYSIPADSHAMIRMFVYYKKINVFDGITVGESPVIAPGNDNGFLVFPVYLSAAHASVNAAPGIVVTAQKINGPYGNKVEVLHITGYSSSKYDGLATTGSLNNYPLFGESSFVQNSNTVDMGVIGISTANNTTDMKNFIGVGMGYQGSYISGNYIVDGHATYGSGPLGQANGKWNFAEIRYNGSAQTGYTGYMSSSPWPITASSSETFDANPLSNANSLYLTLSGNTSTGNQWNLSLGWAFLTYQPPNGIMPGVHSIVQTTSGFTEYYNVSFKFTGLIIDSPPLSYVTQTNVYLAGGEVIGQQGSYSSFISQLPANVYNNSGNISFQSAADTISGPDQGVSALGSSVVQMVSANTISNSYFIGENITFLTQTQLPYSAIVTGINITAFNYTLFGAFASALYYGYVHNYDSYFSIHSGTNTVRLSLRNVLSLYSLNIEESVFDLVNL